MQYPLILISSGRKMGSLSIYRQQSELYGRCLAAAHGIGTLYTGGDFSHIAARCDGLLLSGGGDIHPARFGQHQEGEALSIDAVRDQEEQSLFEAFYRRQKPIFGICRGMQAINVFLGGSLHQNIGEHNNTCHKVHCTAALSSLIGVSPTVNSFHHQAVDITAPSLSVAARADDGCTEALIHQTAPILGVQWHPERMVPPICEDASGENHLALFHWLIERC